MKKQTLFIMAIAATMLASCGITKNNDFSSRKYTKFRKGESSINQGLLEKNTKETAVDLLPTDLAASESNVSDIIPMAEQLSLVENEKVFSFAENISESPITAKQEKVGKIKIRAARDYIARRLTDKANTVSVYSDNTVLLVILAIFIPPLAVALARGIGNEFWLDLLLTILFFLPGMIYALLIVLDAI